MKSRHQCSDLFQLGYLLVVELLDMAHHMRHLHLRQCKKQNRLALQDMLDDKSIHQHHRRHRCQFQKFPHQQQLEH
jgi:hypothetical protein